MVLVTRMFIGLTNSGLDPLSSNTWRLSVKVGDLVRDMDSYTDQNGYTGEYGIIIEVDEPEGMYKVIWNTRGSEWLTEMYLEVVVSS